MTKKTGQNNFIDTRSFLMANVENILSNISSRRESKKIDTDDLFGDISPVQNTQNSWITEYKTLSKLDILMMEKEILGLYVSGNPLQDYIQMQDWVREVSGYDDIYIVVVEKIKKIFTKAGAMMLGMNITIIPEEGKEAQIEGVVYSKKTPALSPVLEDKKLYWVKGKLSEPKEKPKTNESISSDDVEGEPVFEAKEYVESTKLIFDEACVFGFGVLGIFANGENPLSNPRREILESVNWSIVAQDPELLGQQSGTKAQNIPPHYEVVQITIRDSLSIDKVKEIKSKLILLEDGIQSETHYKVKLKIIHNDKEKIMDKNFWISKLYYSEIKSIVS
jgi:hypothetical protein